MVSLAEYREGILTFHIPALVLAVFNHDSDRRALEKARNCALGLLNSIDNALELSEAA